MNKYFCSDRMLKIWCVRLFIFFYWDWLKEKYLWLSMTSSVYFPILKPNLSHVSIYRQLYQKFMRRKKWPKSIVKNPLNVSNKNSQRIKHHYNAAFHELLLNSMPWIVVVVLCVSKIYLFHSVEKRRNKWCSRNAKLYIIDRIFIYYVTESLQVNASIMLLLYKEL